ncbi:MAG: T9SS type A sorting domain-containing protein [Candidatus Cloacimonetes bacterium]|nr:T9SS type A sorting domain-containing protein [Candidatus Cloacimonadota bacterium]
MKKLIIIIMLIIHTVCINSQNINNISNIQYDDVFFYFHTFTGPINVYENRMIIANQYSIIDCEILESGDLETLKVYETKISTLEKSFIDDDRYYFFYKFNSSLWLKVFDLTSCPMIEIFDMELPISLSSLSNPFVTESFLILPDSPTQRAFIYDKNTLEYQGFINNLYGLSTYTDSLLIKAYYSFEDNDITHTIIKFFDLNEIFNFSDNNYIQEFMIDNIGGVTNLKVHNHILYVMFFNNVVLYDISNIENIYEIIRISIPSNIDNPEDPNIFYFTDAFLVEDYLITYDNLYGCNVYNVADSSNVFLEYILTNGNSHFNNLQIIYPYLYVCSSKGLMAFDILNDFELVQNYFINKNDLSIYISKSNYYVSVYDEVNNSYNFYSVLNRIEMFDLCLDVFVDQSSFCIAENKLFFLYKYNDSFYLNIYNIYDHSLNLLNSYSLDIDNFIDIRYYNNYIYINQRNNLSYYSKVYAFVDEELSLFCIIPGKIESESGISEINNIVFNNNNRYVFRDINMPDSVLFISNTVNASSNNQFTHLTNNVIAGISPYDIYNSIYNLRLFTYDCSTQLFSQFLSQYFNVINIFNNVITENNNSQNSNLFYSVLNDNIVQIGAKEQEGQVARTYFFPEHNKFIEMKYSGYHIYNFDYTVSSSDQVVEYERDTYVYPNPVNGGDVNFKTSIADKDTEISIYNIKGQLVKTSKAFQTKDNESIFTWDKRNNQNQSVASGVYFYKIKTDDKVKTGKFLIMK